MGRGKAYAAVQIYLLKSAFRTNMSPRQVMAARPEEGFTLAGLKVAKAKYSNGTTLRRKEGSGRKKERTRRSIKSAKKMVGGDPNISQRQIAQKAGVTREKTRRIAAGDLELKTYRSAKAQKIKCKQDACKQPQRCTCCPQAKHQGSICRCAY